jgi:hypothetical protein
MVKRGGITLILTVMRNQQDGGDRSWHYTPTRQSKCTHFCSTVNCCLDGTTLFTTTELTCMTVIFRSIQLMLSNILQRNCIFIQFWALNLNENHAITIQPVYTYILLIYSARCVVNAHYTLPVHST